MMTCSLSLAAIAETLSQLFGCSLSSLASEGAKMKPEADLALQWQLEPVMPLRGGAKFDIFSVTQVKMDRYLQYSTCT